MYLLRIENEYIHSTAIIEFFWFLIPLLAIAVGVIKAFKIKK